MPNEQIKLLPCYYEQTLTEWRNKCREPISDIDFKCLVQYVNGLMSIHTPDESTKENNCPCIGHQEGCNYVCPCAHSVMSGGCVLCHNTGKINHESIKALLEDKAMLDWLEKQQNWYEMCDSLYKYNKEKGAYKFRLAINTAMKKT